MATGMQLFASILGLGGDNYPRQYIHINLMLIDNIWIFTIQSLWMFNIQKPSTTCAQYKFLEPGYSWSLDSMEA